MHGELASEVVSGVEVTFGSDNIFADLGRLQPEDHALKSDLATQLRLAIKDKGFTQTQAARVLGIPQPHLSRILRGHFENVSVERLLRLLIAIGKNVVILVSERMDGQAPKGIRVQGS